jgi:hypothetical protein
MIPANTRIRTGCATKQEYIRTNMLLVLAEISLQTQQSQWGERIIEL